MINQTIFFIALLSASLLAAFVERRTKKTFYVLTQIITIDGKNRIISKIKTEGYRKRINATMAMEFLLNDLTHDKTGENIYFTSLTGHVGDDERTLTIKEVTYIFKIQQVKDI